MGKSCLSHHIERDKRWEIFSPRIRDGNQSIVPTNHLGASFIRWDRHEFISKYFMGPKRLTETLMGLKLGSFPLGKFNLMGFFPRYLRHWDGNAGWDTMGMRWGTRWESYNDSHACNWDSMGTRWSTSWENKICPMPRYESMNGTDNFIPSRSMGHSSITGKCMRHASTDLDGDISALDWWCSLHWLHWPVHPRCTGLVVHCCATGMCWPCQIMRLLQVQQIQTAENCISVLHTPLWTWHEWPMFGHMPSSFWSPQLRSIFTCMWVCVCKHLATGWSQPVQQCTTWTVHPSWWILSKCKRWRMNISPSLSICTTYNIYYSKLKSYHGL